MIMEPLQLIDSLSFCITIVDKFYASIMGASAVSWVMVQRCHILFDIICELSFSSTIVDYWLELQEYYLSSLGE
jgi:hypothetical protein